MSLLSFSLIAFSVAVPQPGFYLMAANVNDGCSDYAKAVRKLIGNKV
jgi:hypothetical protein